MATDPKRERLKSLALFRGADDTALDHLVSAVDQVTVAEGHTLIRQGNHHNEMFVLANGSATVEIDGAPVADIPAGEFVGELSFFNRGPATATVTGGRGVRGFHHPLQPIRSDPRRQPSTRPCDRHRTRRPARSRESTTARQELDSVGSEPATGQRCDTPRPID